MSDIQAELARQAKIKYALAEERVRERFLEAMQEAKGELTDIRVSFKNATVPLLDDVSKTVSPDFELVNMGHADDFVTYRLIPKKNEAPVAPSMETVNHAIRAEFIKRYQPTFLIGIMCHLGSLVVLYATAPLDPWLSCFHFLFVVSHLVLFSRTHDKSESIQAGCLYGFLIHFMCFVATYGVIQMNWVTFSFLLGALAFHLQMMKMLP
jgi:hypothetical protein